MLSCQNKQYQTDLPRISVSLMPDAMTVFPASLHWLNSEKSTLIYRLKISVWILPMIIILLMSFVKMEHYTLY